MTGEAMEQSTLKLFLMGRRVLTAELVQQVKDIGYLQREIEGERRSWRRRVSRRLRNQRLRAQQQLRIDKLTTAGYVLARDAANWQRWLETSRLALEGAIHQVGLDLPREPLLASQIKKALAIVAHTSVPLKIHVNSHTSASLNDLLSTALTPFSHVAHSVVITAYLEDNACIIETPAGLYEASVGREVDAFCQGVRDYLADWDPADDAGGKP